MEGGREGGRNRGEGLGESERMVRCEEKRRMRGAIVNKRMRKLDGRG